MTTKSSPLTRAELVQSLRSRLSVSAKDANRIIDSALDAISDTLAEKGTVSLTGLGRFQVKPTPARPARNPKTGVPAQVPMHHRPTFAMSRNLRERMLEYGTTQLHMPAGKGVRPGTKRPARGKGLKPPEGA